ncbi:hypothetical protein SAMN05216534_0264 [Candidatus Aquiluna sp. UB-MaderosW2red]|jgi:hypothetical protein|nr:hypothetical protein SAMN05216534_0264 [Candidatus Aquiluna sp. UB-MaderosW2red]
MIGENVTDQSAENTAQVSKSVSPTLGFPNNRLEQSPTPTGWQGLDSKNIVNVSRETLSGANA